MAASPQYLSVGEAWSGLWTGGSVPRDFQQMDDLGKLAWISRDRTGFNNYIHRRFKKSRNVKDRVFKTQQIHEFERFYTVKTGSTDNYHTKFGITNEQAHELQANDVLFHTNLFAQPTGEDLQLGQVNSSNQVPTNPIPPALKQATGQNISNILFSRQRGLSNGVYYFDYEQMLVTAVGDDNSAGVGYTEVTVMRCFMGPGGRDREGAMINRNIVDTAVNTYAATAAFRDGDRLIKSLPSWKEGTGAPHGYGKMPIIDTNFTQEFKYALEKTTESDIRVSASSMMDPIELQKKLKSGEMLRQIEFQFIFGRKGVYRDRAGKEQFMTGGVMEWIPRDEDHCLTYTDPTVNYSGILDLMYKIDQVGGSKEKELFLSPTLYNQFKKAFHDNPHMIFDKDQSAHFDVPVYSLIGSASKLNLHPLYILEDAGIYNMAIALDFGFDSFAPVTHDGWDMKIKTNIQNPGDEIYKESVTGIKGLERRYPDYHCLIQF